MESARAKTGAANYACGFQPRDPGGFVYVLRIRSNGFLYSSGFCFFGRVADFLDGFFFCLGIVSLMR